MLETPQHNALDVIDEIFEKLLTVIIQNINSTCNFFLETHDFLILTNSVIVNFIREAAFNPLFAMVSYLLEILLLLVAINVVKHYKGSQNLSLVD